MPSASLATLLLCLAHAPAPALPGAAVPVPPDSQPVPPDSPSPPDIRPVPPDIQPVPPDSQPVPPDIQPVPPDSPTSPPTAPSPRKPAPPPAAPTGRKPAPSTSPPVPKDSPSLSRPRASDVDRSAARDSHDLTWSLESPDLPPVPSASPPPDPMRVRLAVDLPVIGASLAIALGSEFVHKEQTWAGCGACDRDRINPLDRTALGNHSAAARTLSDVGLISIVALPFALDLGDVLIQRARDRSPTRSRHLRSWGKDLVVLLETFSVTYAATNVVKLALRRPRPYSYDPASTVADPTENDARLSFFSGHASLTFAMATSYAYLFQARHPTSRWVAPVWVLGMSLASVTAVARVEAGKHFWTDVIVGAAAGAGIGLLVPALHRNRVLGGNLGLQLAPTRTGSLLLVQGRF